jgi:hypothetical protein
MLAFGKDLCLILVHMKIQYLILISIIAVTGINTPVNAKYYRFPIQDQKIEIPLIIQLDESISNIVIDKTGFIEPIVVLNQRQKFFNYLASALKDQFKEIRFADDLNEFVDGRNSLLLRVINYKVVAQVAKDQSLYAKMDPPRIAHTLITTFLTELIYNGKSYGKRKQRQGIYYVQDAPIENLHNTYKSSLERFMKNVVANNYSEIKRLRNDLFPPPIYPEWLSKYDTLMNSGNLKMNGGVTLYSLEESALSLIGRPDTIMDYISDAGGEHIKAYGYGEGSRLNYHERRGNKKEWYLSNFRISTPKIYFTLRGVTFKVGDKIEVIAEILPKSYANRRKAFTNKNGYKETGYVSIELPFYSSYMKQFTVDDMGGFYIEVDENGVIVSIGKGYRYT